MSALTSRSVHKHGLPGHEADKKVLERVQMKAVAMVSGLVNREYEARLTELSLLLLEEQRHQADMCLMHKIMDCIGGLHQESWFERASDIARVTRVAVDGLKVKVKTGRLELRRSF